MLQEQLAKVLDGLRRARAQGASACASAWRTAIRARWRRWASEFGVTRERIRQIESKTLAKLRHPSLPSKLKDYLED